MKRPKIPDHVALKDRLSEAQNHRCCMCGKRMGANGIREDYPTFEHIVPVARGGTDDEDNLVIACMACNERRGSSDNLEPHSERGRVNDWSKLRIEDGVIHYGLYQQGGTMRPMSAPDTIHNRQCVSWMQIHDRF